MFRLFQNIVKNIVGQCFLSKHHLNIALLRIGKHRIVKKSENRPPLVWLLSTLHELMRFQVSSLTKRISALCTFVYLLPSVGNHGYLLDQITFHILSIYVPLFHCGRARVC